MSQILIPDAVEIIVSLNFAAIVDLSLLRRFREDYNLV